MYDELIAALRFCDGGECDGCCEYKKEHGCNTLLRDAADVIEALSMKLLGDEAAIAGMKREIERMIVTGADKPKWIPVTERLPVANGRYLVTRGLNACGALWNRMYIINYSDLMGLKSERIWWQGNVGKSDFERFDDVIAWMPLPKPYEEGADND